MNEDLVPGGDKMLVILDKLENLNSSVTASEPPVHQFTSPFAGDTVQQVAGKLKSVSRNINVNPVYFVVLDSRSKDDGTCLLVENPQDSADNGALQTVRTVFGQAQVLLVSLQIATTGMQELQENAEESGGVLAG